MIVFVLALIVILVIFAFLISNDLENKNCWSLLFEGIFTGWVTVVLILIIGATIDSHLHPEGIVKPIDVYRGNTELKINGYMQDSTFVPSDSTVVFKDKYLLKFVK